MGYVTNTGAIIYWIVDQTFISKEDIMLGLISISIVSSQKTSTIQILLFFNNILTVFFIIRTCSTLLHVKCIAHTLYFVIQQYSHTKLSYPLL